MAAALILSKYNEEISSLGNQLRLFLLKELEHINEQTDLSANIISYGYGPGYKDTICVIIPSKNGIKLGFYKGSMLDDPSGLLTGSGKVHKYVEITSEKVIHSSSLKRLIKAALDAYHKRIKK